MKKQHLIAIFFVLFVGMLFLPNILQAQVWAYYNLNRPYEFRMLLGDKFEEFYGTPIEQLHVYAYHSDKGGWAAIPFQIDEKGADHYYLPDDGLWDEDDELVIMLRDMGDRVTPDNWIDNIEAQVNQRYEIQVYDYNDNSIIGWAYVYKSSSITEKSPVQYLSYDPQADKVSSLYYEAGHNSNGVLSDFVITPENGGTGVDILDRQKTRISGLLGPGLEYEMNEDSIRKANVDYIAGPLRVVRRINSNIIVAGDTLFYNFKMTSRFSPFAMDYSGHAELITQQGVGLVRQSWDFNENASGMTFHSTKNRNVAVDGQADGAVDDSLEHNTLNWMMLTGDPGTIFAVNDLSFVGSSQRLYYWDNATGSTGDETLDTGDDKSYGDMGIVIRGYRIKDTLDFKSTIFFMPANQSPDIGEPRQAEFANPLSDLVRLHSPMAVDDVAGIGVPQKFQLMQNHPNPFNASTTLRFDLPRKSHVNLRIMNLLGQTIRTLADESLPSGRHTVSWDGLDSQNQSVVSGVYFSVLEADNYKAIRKLILIK